jgi:hypothetical protein
LSAQSSESALLREGNTVADYCISHVSGGGVWSTIVETICDTVSRRE